MKKGYIFGLVALVLAGAGVFYVLTNQNSNANTTNSTDTTQKPTTFTTDAKDACSVFTKEDAIQLLGSVGSDDMQTPGVENETVAVSTCTYMENTDSMPVNQIKNAKQASLLVRAAKSSEQAEANKATFGDKKPAAAEDVSGYGDKAFWDSNTKQLNVLKGNNWYIITNGTATLTTNTLEETKKLADLLKDKL